MSRNVESHFAELPTKEIGRSKLKRPCTYSTTMNAGYIVPIYRDEVLPGDTININMSSIVRMTTPIAPVMDNAWMDTYFFYVPNRLVWEHWEEFMGENKTDAWTQQIEYQIPSVKAPNGGWTKGTIADYFAVPQNVDNIELSALWFRAYALIYNEWFRNENVSEPAEINLGDETTTGSNGNDYVVDLQKGGMPARAVKYADYFTRALPEAQKGQPVYLPLGSTAPIVAHYDLPDSLQYPNADIPVGNTVGFYEEVNGRFRAFGYDGNNWEGNTNNGTRLGVEVDLSNAVSATVAQLRQAFAVQRLAEIDARSGTRYIEQIAAHFGINSPDARHQRPEYLGGKRTPINISEVVQQSSTDATSPQGNVAAMSKTIDSNDVFTWSATEHGMIIGLAVIRTEHTYQQGLDRILTRKQKLDYYFPELSNISEQYIKNKEIYAQGTAEDEEAFGYQEAWAEYRYGINHVTGELNSNYAQSLDVWTYADHYSQLPTLSSEWMLETDENVKRTLAIQTQDQFIANFYFDQTWTRPMPIYSIPGLTSWH